MIVRQFGRFGVVGIANTLVSLVVYSVLLAIGTPYVLATAVAFAAGAVNGYVLNRRWTFRAEDSRRARALYVAVQLGGLLITAGLVGLLVRDVGMIRIAAYPLNGAGDARDVRRQPILDVLAGNSQEALRKQRYVLAMDQTRDREAARVTRRRAITTAGGALAALLGGGVWARESKAAGVGPAAVASGAVTCVLTPELTEGPYYIANEKVRRNITEGRPGAPLLLHLSVVDASTCRPIKGALVDIWHADAGGTYSGFGSGASSRTFMRGIQPTDAKGVATFQTVYPGWYQGRAVHIHVKAHVGGNVVHTGQLFFSDSFTDSVYKRSPYNKRPNRTTRNANDSIYVNGGSKSVLSVRKNGTGYTGAVTMGIHTS